jgi:methanethiol S-methyltransferase
MTNAISVFLAVAAYGAAHSLLASLPAKAFARKLAGPRADNFYRLLFNVIVTLTFLPVLAVLGRNLGPVVWRIPSPWWAVAAAAEIAALVLLGGSFLQSDPASFLGLRQLGGLPASGGLNTAGAYAVVRHPMYTAGLVFIWVFPIMTTGLLAFDLGITLYILLGSELEERKLIAQFGEAYLRYKTKVARLIPFIY